MFECIQQQQLHLNPSSFISPDIDDRGGSGEPLEGDVRHPPAAAGEVRGRVGVRARVLALREGVRLVVEAALEVSYLYDIHMILWAFEPPPLLCTYL